MTQQLRQQPSSFNIGVYLSLPIILIILFVIVIFGSYFTVNAGYVGVITRFGAVQEGVYGPGLHFKVPLLDAVRHIDAQVHSVDAVAGAASKDMQVVSVDVAVPYYLEPALIPGMINAFGTRERFEKGVLAVAIQESVKATTAEYTAEQLITQREEAKAKIVKAIDNFVTSTLDHKGLKGLAPIANVGIRDFDFSKEFNAAIETKVRMQQEASRAIVEKQKRITEAEAKQAEVELAAKAEAFKVAKEAEARAAAINAEGAALRQNPSLIQLRIAERWDGVLPRFSGGSLPLLTFDAKDVGERLPTPQEAKR